MHRGNAIDAATARSSVAPNMNIHEYQAKELFLKYGVPTPGGSVASTSEEAAAAATALGGKGLVVKAQVHAGDISIKADVVEIKFPGFDFAGVFFGEVALADDDIQAVFAESELVAARGVRYYGEHRRGRGWRG